MVGGGGSTDVVAAKDTCMAAMADHVSTIVSVGKKTLALMGYGMPNESIYTYLTVEQLHDLVLALMGQSHKIKHPQLQVYFWKANLHHGLDM